MLSLSPLRTWTRSHSLLRGQGPLVKYRMSIPGCSPLVLGWEDQGAVEITLPIECLPRVGVRTLPRDFTPWRGSLSASFAGCCPGRGAGDESRGQCTRDFSWHPAGLSGAPG